MNTIYLQEGYERMYGQNIFTIYNGSLEYHDQIRTKRHQSLTHALGQKVQVFRSAFLIRSPLVDPKANSGLSATATATTVAKGVVKDVLYLNSWRRLNP